MKSLLNNLNATQSDRQASSESQVKLIQNSLLNPSFPASFWKQFLGGGLLAAVLLLDGRPANAQYQRSFINPSFETPNLGSSACFMQIDESFIPGWNTTHTSSSFNGNCPNPNGYTGGKIIELWTTTFQSVSTAPNAGRQFAELNAEQNSTLFQRMCLINGETIDFSMLHRGRGSATIPDVMNLAVAGIQIGRFSTTSNGTITTSIAGSDTTLNAPTQPGNGWAKYSGKFIYKGATGLQDVGFSAVSTGSGNVTVGNFLDDIQYYGKPVIEFTSASSGGPESQTTPATPPQIRVSGYLPTDIVVPISVTGGTATIGSDFTTPTGNANFSITIPSGNYDGTTGSTFSLPITIVNDTIPEPDKTITFALGAGASYIQASTTTCGSSATVGTTYTIFDDDKSISGNVFNDINGSKLKDVSGENYTAANITAVLLDSNNNVVTTAPVDATGNYTLVLDKAKVGSYSVKIIQTPTTTLTAGIAIPAARDILPPNLIVTGENLNGVIDAVADRTQTLNVTTNNISGVNFGIAATASLTVTKTTSTANIKAGEAATYTILVRNNSTVPVTGVSIADTLPTGFTYDSTVGNPTLTNSSTRTTTVNPTAGSGTPSWGTFSIPAGGSVSITFIANVPTAQAIGTYQNPVTVTYTDNGTTRTNSYDPTSSTGEDVTVAAPAPVTQIPDPSPGPTRTPAGFCAVPGKDGPQSLSGVVNTYYSGSGSAASGAKSITLGGSVGGNPTGISAGITAGDLLMVIQMQDASINSSNSNLYGAGSAGNDGRGQTNMGSTGLYEYVVATNTVAATGGTLSLTGGGGGGGLVNNYNNAAATGTSGQKRFQVIRVPQFSNLTLTSTLAALPWNGTAGGVVAIDVAGQLNFNGRTIDGVNRGFRGGYSQKSSSGNSTLAYVGTTSTAIGAGKGEGTAGTPRFVWDGTIAVDNNVQGYPAGDFGRGAPSNAGGGGNFHNAGGGGGGNGGLGGNGALPWEGAGGALDSGGRGGAYSSLFSPDPGQLFLGGGGGGGDANNATTGVRGGVGGGLVILRAGTLTGTGTINVTGDAGDVGAFANAPDGAGGGGAGGSVLVATRQPSISANLNILAGGGAGGNTLNDGGNEHGPGAGGGGGVVLYNAPGVAITSSIAGGLSGKSNGGVGTPHGAQPGTEGKAVPFTSSVDPFSAVNGDGCLPKVNVVKTTTTPSISQGGLATYSIVVRNDVGTDPRLVPMDATGVEFQDVLPAGFTYDSTVSIVPDAGVIRTSTNDPVAGATTVKWGKFTIPAGKKVTIIFKAASNATIPVGKYDNPAVANYLDPKRATATDTTNAVYDEKGNTGEDVTIANTALKPELLLVKRITEINGSSSNPNDNTPLNQFVDDTTSPKAAEDNNPNWPTGSLIGAIDGGKVKTGNTIEYTIYLLSSGTTPAKNVLVCDRIPANSIFKPDGYANERGILFNIGGTSSQITNVPDNDAGQYFSPGSDPTGTYPNVNCGGPNINGAIVIQVGNLTNATTPTTPNSFSFFKFRAVVK